ncbi:hypothetical protein ABZS66_14925 [Dactylosporangium sp. NPDC005572]|uniref:hypothetical protein n=1 Tax=Dactylosporangium sp. NPDC005572 TaxID=3156889 RepID=UPI0033BB1260
MGWLQRRRARARRRRIAEGTSAGDAWTPALGSGPWRVWYAECCDALLAFDRVVAALPPGPVRDGVHGHRPSLVALLDTARRTAELGAFLDPDGPGRSPALVAALAADPLGDLTGSLGPSPTLPLRDRVLLVRAELAGIADAAARIGLRLHEHPHATDVGTWLSGLGAGVDQAHRAAWLPVTYRAAGEDQ